jgi:hypothetical protein
MPDPVLPPARYEHSDVTSRAALIAFPIILVGLLAAVLLVRWIYPGTAVDRRFTLPLPSFPPPRLQADPAADMRKFLGEELARLNSSGWDDQASERGHISIGEAMRRIATSGIPDWPK